MTSHSPRTLDEPMAFTWLDLIKGALWTWLTFMFIIEAGVAGYAVGVQSTASPTTFIAVAYVLVLLIGYTTLFGGAISLAVTLALTPVAWILGRLLRRRRPMGLHLLAYTVLGCATAGLAAGVFSVAGSDLFIGFADPLVLTCLVATVISVPVGWWLSARKALSDDVNDVRS